MTDQTETGRIVLPVELAAAAMNTPLGTFRRWMRRPDFPMVQRGQRGRGHVALVDVEAVKAWRDRPAGADAGLLGAELPELLAGAFAEAFRRIEGPDKRRMAGVLVASWHTVSSHLLEVLRDRGQDVPELDYLPQQIEQLLEIAHSVDSF